jgi:hypothetical protein
MKAFVKREHLKALIAVGIAAGTVSVQAALIDVGNSLTISGTIAAQDQGANNIGYVSYGGGTAEHVYAGAFDVTVVNHSQANNTFTIGTFCTDVNVNWKPTDNYTAVTFAGQTGIEPAWSAVPQAIQNASWLYNTFFVGQNLNANQDAGMQLAIWKVLYDTGANGTIGNTASAFSGANSGKFNAAGFGSLAMNWANTYVADVINARSGGFAVYTDTWLKPDDGNSQGLIWNADTPGPFGPTPVPETTTMIAGALLLLPMGASALRILRRKNVS